MDASTLTDPDCLGPCEPGTSVVLEGLVWAESNNGMNIHLTAVIYNTHFWTGVFTSPSIDTAIPTEPKLLDLGVFGALTPPTPPKMRTLHPTILYNILHNRHSFVTSLLLTVYRLVSGGRRDTQIVLRYCTVFV